MDDVGERREVGSDVRGGIVWGWFGASDAGAVSVSALVLVLALAAAVLGLLCFLALRKLSVERIVLNSG